MVVRFYLPALALFGWAFAAAMGVDHDVLRILGPLLTGLATAFHIREEIRRHGGE